MGTRTKNPSSLRGDGHLAIGEIQANGITRAAVTTCVHSMGGSREVCVEIAQEVGGKTKSLAATMSKDRARALILLLLTAVEEG